MDMTSIELILWIVIVVLVFLVVNNYVGLKRFGSALIAFFIASFVVFLVFNSILSEVFMSMTFLILAFFGLTTAFRSKRSDF
jgi:hypothetical protein